LSFFLIIEIKTFEVVFLEEKVLISWVNQKTLPVNVRRYEKLGLGG